MEKDINLKDLINDDKEVAQEPVDFNLERRINMLTEKIIETTNFIKENRNYDRE